MMTNRMPGALVSVVLAGVLLGLLGSCSSPSDQSAKTPSDSTLSEEQWSKIDPDLTRLMSDSVRVTDVPSRRRTDGSRVYSVWIQTSDRAALEAIDVSAASTQDGRVRAWLSLSKMREVARLDAVERIRADNDPVPRDDSR